MTNEVIDKLGAECADRKKEIERLEGELKAAHKEGSVISATGLAIAITTRQDAVDAIEAIIGKAAP